SSSNHPPPTASSTLSLHDALPISLILIDERADVAQRTAIEVLLGGKVGGPWAVLGWTWPKVHGPYAASYDLVFDGVKTRMKCGRSEEHTSELQSQSNLVCRLLLEK